ncbi:MAG: hypothetical protein ABUK13_02635 [Gammaproteobacteria bacterium]
MNLTYSSKAKAIRSARIFKITAIHPCHHCHIGFTLSNIEREA